MADIFTSELLERLRHETPFFVFSKQALRERYRDFKKNFPHASIYYAMKADAEKGVIETLAAEGSSFEAASVHELHILKELGIPADRILYGTSVKPVSHIKEFYEYGVNRFAFDSFPELDKIAAIAPKARVYVRVSVNDTGSIYRFSEKFGTVYDNVVPLLVRARELGLEHYGISFHVGSQAGNRDAWAHAIRSLVPVIKHLDEIGIRIEILPYKPQLVLEPGRAMVADAAVLVATVIARVERVEHTWLFLDAGVYNGLFETLAYQGSIRYRITSLRPSYNVGESVFALAGPTGDSWDVISREAHLPNDIGQDDRLVFHSVGAYNLVMVGRFNGFPKPPVYYA